MKTPPKQFSTKGSTELVTGEVWYDLIVRGEEPSRARVDTVRFVRPVSARTSDVVTALPERSDR